MECLNTEFYQCKFYEHVFLYPKNHQTVLKHYPIEQIQQKAHYTSLQILNQVDNKY